MSSEYLVLINQGCRGTYYLALFILIAAKDELLVLSFMFDNFMVFKQCVF